MAAGHQLAAKRTLSVEWTATVARVEECFAWRRRLRAPVNAQGIVRGLFNQSAENTGGEPETGAASALQERHVADLPMAQTRQLAAGRADQRRLLAGQRLGTQGQSAMVAEPGPIAYAGETFWADGVQVLFVEREVGPAVTTGSAALFARRAAR